MEPKRLTEAAMEVIQGASFTGNVRELENLCQWITVMAHGQTVEVVDLLSGTTRTGRQHRQR
ncbi:hypothetical protein [Paludibacterium denitrificans]|uniref:hypothetical protein n=1 Tax=Paludibacterium denitrificans TaxID=2675226 RepID=UPI002477F32B|nr:hypothetical protein [Paludibacterium denitrificans]